MDLQRAASRRRLLTATIGSLAAAGAATIGAPVAALAADDGPLLLGKDNEAASMTALTRTSVPDTEAATFFAETTISAAIGGHATTGQGMVGRSVHGTGVQGYSQTGAGLNGFGMTGLWAAGDDIGVQGVCEAGRSVYGWANSGIAGSFESTSGFALSTSGRIRLAQVSGIATIDAGTRTKLVAPEVDLVGSSFVLLTPRSNLGTRALWHTVDPTANTFTIRLSSAAPSNVRVGWLLIG